MRRDGVVGARMRRMRCEQGTDSKTVFKLSHPHHVGARDMQPYGAEPTHMGAGRTMGVVGRLVRRPGLICRGNTRPPLLADRVVGCEEKVGDPCSIPRTYKELLHDTVL